MSHNILLIGGHGKIAQLLTPLLLSRSWNVTSMIRTSEQTPAIEKLGKGQPGKLNVFVSSVEDVNSEGDAQKILDQIKPDWVIWSAGAGGRGGAERTNKIDRDAAIAFTKASARTSSVKKFLTVSYNSSRRKQPSWWNDEQWASAQKVNTEVLPTYFKAKVAADEVLTVLAKERLEAETKSGVAEVERFAGISLRPGHLSDEKAAGIKIGKIEAKGQISRATVTEAIVAVLETDGARGWIDILDGDKDVKKEVEKIVSEGFDSVEGEDLEEQKQNASQF